jgi:predicted PhzF superfamily epimerase YddE/YHI9
MIISQGTQLGRTGRVHIRRDETKPTRILVGGHTIILITGALDL